MVIENAKALLKENMNGKWGQLEGVGARSVKLITTDGLLIG